MTDPTPRPKFSQQDSEAIQGQRHALGMASSLLQDAAFRWFLEECLDAKIAEAQEAALDTTSPMEARNTAAHLRAAFIDARGWVEARRAAAVSTIEAIGA